MISRKCPIPAGIYTISKEGWSPDMTNVPPFLQSGDYILEIVYFDRHGQMLQGWQIYVNLINITEGDLELK